MCNEFSISAMKWPLIFQEAVRSFPVQGPPGPGFRKQLVRANLLPLHKKGRLCEAFRNITADAELQEREREQSVVGCKLWESGGEGRTKPEILSK